MNPTPHDELVLIAEDEPKIASVLEDYLVAHGYRTQWVANGREVLPAIENARPDLLLLDIMLPGMDGMEICRELRQSSNLPVIMVTARVEEIDRILGLELGADDYICKPFSPREVVARVKSVLRRRPGRQEPAPGNSIFRIEEAAHRISVADRALDLTRNEFHLLHTFLVNPGRVFSREQLLDKLYDGFREVTDRAIDSHIKNLRKKIARHLPGRELIVSVYGVGYRFEEQEPI